MQNNPLQNIVTDMLRLAGGVPPTPRHVPIGHNGSLDVLTDEIIHNLVNEALTLPARNISGVDILEELCRDHERYADAYAVLCGYETMYNLCASLTRSVGVIERTQFNGERSAVEIRGIKWIGYPMSEGHILQLQPGWFEFVCASIEKVVPMSRYRALGLFEGFDDPYSDHLVELHYKDRTLVKIIQENIRHYVVD